MNKIIYHAFLKRNAYNATGLRKVAIEYQEGMTIKKVSEILGLAEVGLVILNGVLAEKVIPLKMGIVLKYIPLLGEVDRFSSIMKKLLFNYRLQGGQVDYDQQNYIQYSV